MAFREEKAILLPELQSRKFIKSENVWLSAMLSETLSA
jgi:hypothetical protein